MTLRVLGCWLFAWVALVATGVAPAAATHCGAVTVGVSDPVVAEGDSETVDAVFTITKSAGCAIDVEWSTADRTAFASSGDYFPDSGSLSFGTGAESQTVPIAVVGDRIHEGDEQFDLVLTTLSDHVTFNPDQQGVATITNDDPVPSASINDTGTVEGDSDTRDAVFTITLSNPSSSPVTIEFVTADGTAVVGDYYGGHGNVAFNPGETTATVAVPVVGDTDVEDDETFFLRIHSPTNATIADGEGTAVIADDDRRPAGHGYRMVAADGGIFTFGDRRFHGSTGDIRLAQPIVGGATDVSDYDGYWIVAADGGVFSFGAPFHGALGDQRLSAPAVEIEPTPTGQGYWIVLADGKVHAFGDAGHFGDFGGQPLNRPIIGMAVTSTGDGYWLVGADGGIFSFGSARFFGSTGGLPLNSAVVDLAPTPDGNGYYLVAGDGGVFSFGSADFKGSTGAMTLNSPVVAMLVAPTGAGYWLGAADGGVFTFGAVDFHGSAGGIPLNAPVLDLVH